MVCLLIFFVNEHSKSIRTIISWFWCPVQRSIVPRKVNNDHFMFSWPCSSYWKVYPLVVLTGLRNPSSCIFHLYSEQFTSNSTLLSSLFSIYSQIYPLVICFFSVKIRSEFSVAHRQLQCAYRTNTLVLKSQLLSQRHRHKKGVSLVPFTCFSVRIIIDIWA